MLKKFSLNKLTLHIIIMHDVQRDVNTVLVLSFKKALQKVTKRQHIML